MPEKKTAERAGIRRKEKVGRRREEMVGSTHLKAPNDDKTLNVKLSYVGTDLFKVLLG